MPYTEIIPTTRMILSPYIYKAVLMTGPDSYQEYFQKRWLEGESFINCEHDTVFFPGAIEELEKCPRPWCAFHTSINGDFMRGQMAPLALAKFSAELIEEYPDIWTEMTEVAKEKNNPTPKWMWCDAWLQKCIKQRCHQHYPPVLNAKPNIVQEHTHEID